MRTDLSGATLAALASSRVGFAQLVLMEFPGANVALSTAGMNFTVGGVTYLGASALGTMAVIDSSSGEVKGLQFQMAGVSVEVRSLALDDAGIVPGTPLTIRTALLNSDYQVVDAPIEWVGRLDTMPFSEDGETCTITVTAESSEVDLLRGTARTYSNPDHQSVHPGDRFFEFVPSQANDPIVWPSRDWYIRYGKR